MPEWTSRWIGRFSCAFLFQWRMFLCMVEIVTVDTFKPELEEALRAYEKYIVCIDKTPDQFEASLVSLMTKAIKAYETRDPNLRHGIAVDKQVTIILSQTDG